MQSLKDNVFQLQLQDGKFQGSGAALLEQSVHGSKFVLIGEQHGIAEVSAFSEAVFRLAHPYGFEHLVIETDPFITDKLRRLVPMDSTSVKAFFADYPFAVPFYNNREEFAFLQAVHEISSQRPAIFGIDQVFMGAFDFLCQWLVEIAPDPAAKTLANTYFDQGRKGMHHFLEKGDPSQSLVFTLEKADYSKLKEVFSDAEALDIINGMAKSQEIYQHWFQGRYYQNNYVRSLLMKAQFMEALKSIDAGDQIPKMIFKFGSNHMERGRTPMRIYDIGNMVSEMAAMEGATSLHIKFSGLAGETQDALRGPQAYNNLEDLDAVFKNVLTKNPYYK